MGLIKYLLKKFFILPLPLRDSIKNLLGFAYSTTTYAIPESRIEKLEQEFNEINTEYNLLKNQIELIAIPSDFNKAKTSWNLEFDNSEVTVTEND